MSSQNKEFFPKSRKAKSLEKFKARASNALKNESQKPPPKLKKKIKKAKKQDNLPQKTEKTTETPQKEKTKKKTPKNSKKKPENIFFSKNEFLNELYSKAEQAYHQHAKKQLEKYNISKSDQLWMKKILSSGTMKDKISGLSIYIQDNPKTTLDFVQNLFDYCKGNSKKDSLVAINALKNLFIDVLLPRNTLETFAKKAKTVKSFESMDEAFWINSYYDNVLKQIYIQFIKVLETKANDPISFIRKNVLGYLSEMIIKKPEQENEILKMLVNKFAESDKTINGHINTCLGKLIYKRPTLIPILIKEIDEFIHRPNLTQLSQLHALNFLNTLQTDKMSEEVLQSLLNFFFKLFDKIVQINNDEIISSKLTINIVKGINKIFPNIKEKSGGIKENSLKEIDNLYKIIHRTSNFKIKIQTLLFIFQFLNVDKSLNDRYFRVLYELVNSEEIWHSSLTELFFDLLYFSLKEDSSTVRIKSFVKRLLQNSIHSEPSFLITSLIFISRIFQIHPGVKTLVTYNESNDDHDELKKFSDEEEKSEKNQENQEKVEKPKSYDPFKRDPLYSNADQTCLWELIGLLNHYHPYVKKYAEALIDDIQKSNPIIDYNGNPLLDFNLANFLDRFTFKQIKKKESSGIKSLMNKNKLRMSKIKDPLSIEEVGKMKENEIRDDEKYFLKYFEQKKKMKKVPSKPKKAKVDSEDEMDAFADDIVEEKMNELNKEEDIDEDDDFDEFLKNELEDEEMSENEEEFDDNENLENIFDEDDDQEEEEIMNGKRFNKPVGKKIKKKSLGIKKKAIKKKKGTKKLKKE